jgi:hypothetical protein
LIQGRKVTIKSVGSQHHRNVAAATHLLEHGSADTEMEVPTAALIYARCAVVVGVDPGVPDRPLAPL